MSPALRSSALFLAAMLTLGACGTPADDSPGQTTNDSGSKGSSDSDQSATESPSPSSSSSSSSGAGSTSTGTTISITFSGGSVTPQGKQVKVKAGTPFTLRIKADEPGELHVHSSPESEVAYTAGTTTKKLTIDRPGVVDVESHDLDKLVVQLEVR